MVSKSGMKRSTKIMVWAGSIFFVLFLAYNIIGFFVVPSIVEKQLKNISSERLALQSEVEDISFNPYRFDLAVESFSSADSNKNLIVEFDRIDLDLAPFRSLRSKSLVLDLFSADGLSITLEQIDSETTNIGQIVEHWNQSALPQAPEEEQEDESSDPIAVILNRFMLRNASVEIIDRVPESPLILNVRPINLDISNITTIPGETLSVGAAMTFSDGGNLEFSGSLSYLPSLNAQLDYQLSELSLGWLQPYLDEYSNAELIDGHLNTTGVITSDLTNPLLYRGDIQLNQIDLRHEDETFIAWEQLSLPDLQYSLIDSQLNIGGIQLQEMFAKIIINEDTSTNIGKIIDSEQKEPLPEVDAEIEEAEPVQSEPLESVAATQTAETDELVAEEQSSPISVVIDSIEILEGSAYFSDLSLPLPFATNLTNLNGSISTLATNSDALADLELEGHADEFGLLQASGSINPKSPTDSTELKLDFTNISLPEYSPYLVKLAGRLIETGKLDLDLTYKIDQSQLEGANNIVLRDFTLGERVEHPDAISLPLGLALALLRDPDGTIDIDLPVSGDVNSPEFSYGGIVRKALVNLITNIVSSPFRLLANLAGSEDEELDTLRFAAGESVLTPPEQEKLTKLADALVQRPQLMLELPATYDEELDTQALKQQAFDTELGAQIESIEESAPEGDTTLAIDRRIQALEQIYLGRNLAPTVAELRIDFETAATETTPASFDSAAYVGELSNQLIETQPLEEDLLENLALQRAENAQAYLLEIQPALDSRIETLLASATSEESDDGSITLELSLKAND